MKKILVLLLLIFSAVGFSQIKDSGFPTSSVKDGIISNNSGSLFGFLNSENFQMNHSYNMSYSSWGNNGMALGMYTNSMMYNFADNLNVQLDASIVHSPYSSFGQDHQNSLNGIYISRAAVNYKPWKDVFISVQYNNLPNSYYYSPFGYYNRGSMFDRSGDWFFGR